MIATSILLFYFALTMVIFFAMRMIMVEMFGSIKHFFLKNKGYGWVFIIKPNRKKRRYYMNLEQEEFKIGEHRYYNDTTCQYDFLGINSIDFKHGVNQPIKVPDGSSQTKTVESSTYWHNLAEMQDIKSEIKAKAGMGKYMNLMYIIILVAGGALLGTIYIAYQISQISGV
ncbi:MAG: hypothetical protein R6U11_01750 [Bacteroidales bacterium]